MLTLYNNASDLWRVSGQLCEGRGGGTVLWVGLSLHSSDAGSSGGNRGSALLQPRKSTVAAKWHITHFLLLETSQEVGFCSTEVRKLHRIPNRGFKEHSSGGILQPQQPGVLVQRSTSRQNLDRITILTPQTHFVLCGDSGIVALNDKARTLVDGIPQEQKTCLFHDSYTILKAGQTPGVYVFSRQQNVQLQVT